MMKRLQDLKLEDDFFAKVMSDAEICKEVLKEILEIDIKRVKKLQKKVDEVKHNPKLEVR